MQKVDPLIRQIGQLLDVRFKVFETLFKAEIRASEERVTKRLVKVEKRLVVVEDKLDSNINNHDQRIKKLERQASVSV